MPQRNEKPAPRQTTNGIIGARLAGALAPAGKASAPPPHGIVGASPAIVRVLHLIERMGPIEENLLLQGESGTGKELVARAVHRASRRTGPFVAINCAAIQETLLESELFGHEKGAFTSASSAKPGLFEVAQEGTLFIDEIGELKGPLQAALLRVLEDRRVRRVGSTRWRPTNARVVTATNRNLARDVADNRFRTDLYYRLTVLAIKLPPLRERREDIPLLVRHFLSLEPGGVQEVDREAMQALLAHDWPGNVRELRNALRHAQLLAEGPTLALHDLPEDVLHGTLSPATPEHAPPALPLDLRGAERELVLQALRTHEGNKSRAAQALGISRQSLYRLLSKHELPR
jgi:transcriptional regulator with PAS, ATPase and Fis domain